MSEKSILTEEWEKELINIDLKSLLHLMYKGLSDNIDEMLDNPKEWMRSNMKDQIKNYQMLIIENIIHKVRKYLNGVLENYE